VQAGAERSATSPPAAAASVRVRTDSLDRFLGAVGEVILSTSRLRNLAGGLDPSAEVASSFD